MGELIGLRYWGLTVADLPRMNNVAVVQLQLKYPDYQTLVQYPPRKRVIEIRKLLRQNYQRLLALLPAEIEATGTPRRPRGVKIRLPLHELPRLAEQDFIGNIFIDAIDGMGLETEPDMPSFWCIEARFAVQIEGETKGLQLYEDRMLIIMADSEAEAKKKLAVDFEAYAKPYLNSAGRLVRWQFEAFLDTYRVDIESVNEFAGSSGVEVFSKLRRRRIRPDSEWLPMQ